MTLTEAEKYALLANVPYLINEGVPIDIIEKDLKDYDLDYKIDTELSDAVSSTIVGKNDIVHSVRGTDIKSFKDLVSDAGIISSHPTFIRLFNTIVAGAGGLPLLMGNPEISEELKTALYGMYSGYELLTDWDDGPQMSPEEWKEELIRLDNRIKTIQTRDARKQRIKVNIGTTALLGSALLLTRTKRLITDNIRVEPERLKLEKIMKMYPDKSISLTGHSLGSVVNILGRKSGIKSITFNPAPQETETSLLAHPDSKAYTTKYDPISFFLTKDDTEKRIIVPQKVSNPHSLSNFLPNKSVEGSKFLKQRELKEPQMVIREQPLRRPDFDFCKFYPDNPICKKVNVREAPLREAVAKVVIYA